MGKKVQSPTQPQPYSQPRKLTPERHARFVFIPANSAGTLVAAFLPKHQITDR